MTETKLRRWQIRIALLLCGIGAACIYVLTDIAAAVAYPGYSYTDQAVSELFAIGAPTSGLVVPLFSLSSGLLLLFAVGIALCSERVRALRFLALMFAGSGLVGLVLWNLYPMHMRGVEPTFTDKMHLILATNPFVLATLITCAFAFRGRFRWQSIGAVALILLLALFGFRYAPSVASAKPTPGLGLSERLAQYIYAVWQIGLALVLIRRMQSNSV